MTPRTAPPRPSTGRRRRIIRRTAATLTLAALVIGAVLAVKAVRPDDEVVTTAAPVLRTAAVAAGNLDIDEQVDGSVILSATTTVRHRIDGQLAMSSATSSSSSNTAAPTGNTPNQGPATATQTEALADLCPADGTIPATTPTTVPGSVPDEQTNTTTVDPSTTTSTTTATTTSTTMPTTTTSVAAGSTTTAGPDDPSTSSTDAPTTTLAAPPCPDTTGTTVVDTVPDTSTPQAGPTGGARTGGGGALPSTGSSNSTNGQNAAQTRTTQKVTSTVATGAEVHPGDVLYTVDGTPVVLMIGALPAWRTLSADVDDGADITQLEYSLVALGYTPADGVTVDGHWDDATTGMVEAWQAGMGDEVTGEVPLGSVVFLPTSASVSSVTAAVGDDVGEGDAILTLAAPTQQIVIDVPEELQASVVAGTVVDLDGTEGTVSLLRTVERDGAVVVQAVITPSAALADRANGSTITVDIGGSSGTTAADVMLVPTEALASKLDGSYAVQVDNGDGTSSWVTVTLVGVDGNTVAVQSAELAPGANVLLAV